MSDFKAKIHQNRFRLGLHLRPRREERREREGEGKGWEKVREGENYLTHPLSQIPGYATKLLFTVAGSG